ncbi:MAG: DegT/DnrJ/EryC1/StrS family aminotransferase [Candidatus Omnitrophota bacterium]
MKLAINGGSPVRKKLFPGYNYIGAEEKAEVMRVLDSGVLSQFLGCWHADFYGGPEVRTLEKEWAEYFGAKHAISVNSCTSGLICAVGATGVEPGEEIIVTPYSMCISAAAPLFYNAVPVFADVEEDYYCLDADSIEKRITPRTRAILVVDLFGMPYDAQRINAIAKKHGLIVIEDTAQAPGALNNGKYTGTLGHMGVHSLNYHKHIHSGEGGVILTNDDKLAEKVQLIRNHGEAVVEKKGTKDIVNIIGYNFRMTEMEAAVARCQLRKLKKLLSDRQDNCAYLNEKLGQVPGIVPTKLRKGCTHSYYVHPLKYKEEVTGVPRNVFIDAVRAELAPLALREGEGVKITSGYCRPLYLQPIFQKKIAYGSKGCPFTKPWYEGSVSYDKGICPTVERLFEKELFIHEMISPPMTREDLNDVVKAFEKVYENREELMQKAAGKETVR